MLLLLYFNSLPQRNEQFIKELQPLPFPPPQTLTAHNSTLFHLWKDGGRILRGSYICSTGPFSLSSEHSGDALLGGWSIASTCFGTTDSSRSKSCFSLQEKYVGKTDTNQCWGERMVKLGRKGENVGIGGEKGRKWEWKGWKWCFNAYLWVQLRGKWKGLGERWRQSKELKEKNATTEKWKNERDKKRIKRESMKIPKERDERQRWKGAHKGDLQCSGCRFATTGYLKGSCNSLQTMKPQLLFWMVNWGHLPAFQIKKSRGERIPFHNLWVQHLKACPGHCPVFCFQRMPGPSDERRVNANWGHYSNKNKMFHLKGCFSADEVPTSNCQ